MEPILQIFKKDPFWRGTSALVIICTFWFLLVPGEFKSVWSKNPIVAEIIKEHAQVEQKSKFISIEFYYPYFPYFAEIVIGSQKPKAELMDTYYSGKPYIFRLYYRKVVEMFPESDAGHFLLGICEYYMKKTDAARAEFEKSIELNPYFFWSYYNLGVIDFQKGLFLESAQVLSKAFSFKKEFTLEILDQNFLYGQIWRNIANPSPILERHLNEAQEDAALLLAAYFVKTGKFDQALQMIRTIAKGTSWHPELWENLYKKAASRQRGTEDIDRLIQERIPVRLF